VGLKQSTFCDACKKEVEGAGPPSTWTKIHYQTGQTVEQDLLCDGCARVHHDVFVQLTSGKKPDIAEIPVLQRALSLAANDNARERELVKSLETANENIKANSRALLLDVENLKRDRDEALRGAEFCRNELNRLRLLLAPKKRPSRRNK
jgi:predicted Fe-S protein YdhL (DUF1289 family)